MKKRRQATQRAFTWSVIATINSLVAVMFVAIFTSLPVATTSTHVSVSTNDNRASLRDPVVDLEGFDVVEPVAIEPRAIPAAKKGVPVRIVVPSIGIDLPILTGSYDDTTQAWTLSDAGAFYADRTVPVNDRNGTTLIYGHATSAVFGRIVELAEGSTVTVYTDNNLEFNYEYELTRQVLPTDTTVFDSSGPPQLVLQTCAGQFDAYRAFVAFSLVETVKS